jgi:hypothetical protein
MPFPETMHPEKVTSRFTSTEKPVRVTVGDFPEGLGQESVRTPLASRSVCHGLHEICHGLTDPVQPFVNDVNTRGIRKPDEIVRAKGNARHRGDPGIGQQVLT